MIGKGRSKQQKKGGGVGVLVRQEAGIDVEELDVGGCEMGEDIMAVRLEYKVRKGRERILVIVCYMTVEGTGARAENERKYRIVQRFVEQNRSENVIVMGDMNGHIGVLGEEVNGNGQLLLDFAEENELEILNVTLAEGRVTWIGRENESAIDFMLVNRKARERVRNMWVDEERTIDVASDHNVMVMEYECLKEKRVNVKEERNGRWKLRDADWDYFREVVSNEDWKLGENGLRAERGVDEMNERLLRKLNKVAEESIGRTRKRANGRTRKSWWNNEIDKARKERKQSNRKCRSLRKNRSNSEAERIEYERAWEEYKSK
ncbi:hypothetical protein GWK47_000111 [Chionoecetes opilio]|uniref:Endonuclease/exonuclease/phosphatase domain-containing protein n=1 Tax=Chionoecetes opilio TaxID=41210 RepID=A0A8J4XXZ9_CHIOP|nr:hypothetical protein GWK47_000111 [Chionoecetes opilio]